METINRTETIAMPMLRVECLHIKSDSGKWPEFVQVLPPIGSLMQSDAPYKRAYVASYCFRFDGVIEIYLK